MSTGLIVNGDDEGERGLLASKSFGVVILDEAHKARGLRNSPDGSRDGGNNLMKFMEKIASDAGSVLLGTATPIQLRPVELWDLLNILQQGAPHVLGRGVTEWRRDACIQYLSGERPWPRAAEARWALMKDPLGPRHEDILFGDIRRDARMADATVGGPRYDALSPDILRDFERSFERLSTQHNPIIRRIVRRTRPMLEERGLLKRISVVNHPSPADRLPANLFEGEGLAMGIAFQAAYHAAEDFCRLYPVEFSAGLRALSAQLDEIGR